MKPSEYLDKCKIALKITSHYGLAKALKLHTGLISDFYSGKRWPDAYACAQIALALKLEPWEVLADIEAQSAKTEERREFWRGFIGRTKKAAAVLLLALTFICTLPGGKDGARIDDMVARIVFLWVLMIRIMGHCVNRRMAL